MYEVHIGLDVYVYLGDLVGLSTTNLSASPPQLHQFKSLGEVVVMVSEVVGSLGGGSWCDDPLTEAGSEVRAMEGVARRGGVLRLVCVRLP